MSGERSMTVRAPAKLNLVLAVGARRSDGYHPLVSVMEAIELCDTIHVQVDDASTPSVTVAAPALEGGDTLVTRAITSLLDAAGVSANVNISIDKQIPVGAGLGGGSSDAATALGTVNSLLGSPCSTDQLVQIAGYIGSDVPFFLDPRHGAVVEGRGEHVTPLAPGTLPTRSWMIAWPGTSCATAAVYGAYRPNRTTLPDRDVVVGDASAGRFLNDLADPALALNEQMRTLYERCTSRFGADHVLVAGSGSSIAVALPVPLKGVYSGRCTHEQLEQLGWDTLIHGLDGAVIAYCRSWRASPEW